MVQIWSQTEKGSNSFDDWHLLLTRYCLTIGNLKMDMDWLMFSTVCFHIGNWNMCKVEYILFLFRGPYFNWSLSFLENIKLHRFSDQLFSHCYWFSGGCVWSSFCAWSDHTSATIASRNISYCIFSRLCTLISLDHSHRSDECNCLLGQDKLPLTIYRLLGTDHSVSQVRDHNSGRDACNSRLYRPLVYQTHPGHTNIRIHRTLNSQNTRFLSHKSRAENIIATMRIRFLPLKKLAWNRKVMGKPYVYKSWTAIS